MYNIFVFSTASLHVKQFSWPLVKFDFGFILHVLILLICVILQNCCLLLNTPIRRESWDLITFTALFSKMNKISFRLSSCSVYFRERFAKRFAYYQKLLNWSQPQIEATIVNVCVLFYEKLLLGHFFKVLFLKVHRLRK